MKKSSFLICVILVLCCIFATTLTACSDDSEAINVFRPNETEQAYLTFLDDFTDDLNTDVWNVHDELRRGGYWDKDQAFTKNGNLVLRTVEIDGKYYMGAIDTFGKLETHHGYYEARCILPKACGIWSAFWIMPPDMKDLDIATGGAEIDIMESPYYRPFLNAFKTDTYQCAVHVGNYDSSDPTMYKKTENFVSTSSNASGVPITLYDGNWHTFGLDWTEDYYRFYYDRQLVFEVTDKSLVSSVDSYLFLSIEIGGKDGVASKPDFLFANDVAENPEGTFPIDFLVDYVAIFSQRPF